MCPIFDCDVPDEWPDTAYHRYWMHRDSEHNA